MPSPLVLPQTFTTDDLVRLKSELERLTKEIDRYTRELAGDFLPVPALSLLNPSSLAFGQIARVNIPDGATHVMKLPRPNPANIGKRCGVRRGSTTGEILIYAVDCLVGGFERYRMANDVHFVEFLFDGDFYPSRAGGGA